MINIPEAKEIETRALSVPETARQIEIVDNQSYQKAGSVLTAIKALRKEIDATFDPAIKQAHAAHKAIIDAKKKHDEPLIEAEKIIKPKIATYIRVEEQKRIELERKAQEEERKRAEEEHLKRAIEAEQSGNKDEAELIIEQPVEVVPVIIAKTTPKIEGISTRKLWKFRIVDENKIPRQYLIPNEKAIGGVVRSLGNAANISGVEIYCEESVAARAI